MDLSSAVPDGPLFAFQFSCYYYIVLLVSFAYDWLLSIPAEIEIVSKSGLSWSILIYFFSRISTFGHQFMALAIVVLFTENCQAVVMLTGVSYTIGMATTSFLFFLRVRAIYTKSRYITHFFGALWLATIALTILFNTSLRGGCHSTSSKYSALPSISTFVYDTLVFLAISYRLAADVVAEGSWRSRLLSAGMGRGLFSLSKSIMENGLLYYLGAVVFFAFNWALINLPPMVYFKSSNFPLVPAYVGFTNIMACHVYRNIALQVMHVEQPSVVLTGTSFAFQLESLPADRRSSLEIP
ncbi:hypothetical protein FIBSPDRAFT_893377 [Athelia psychrophila]|uniref:DUF6533 domain-containing protein n=1 Tax=Athelia psychrophila TaxID=1759441 RepID=A0A166H802_9AGAM|nr:hypothetical protein FIBSPDRAFT_893377 [Fibularhizoctonia sp. CBS 109695]